MKQTFFLILFFFNASLFGAQPYIGSIKKLESGLYTAVGITATGEKIYFGYERLDTQSQRDAWQSYSDACQKLVAEHNGWLVELGRHALSDYKNCRKKEHFKNMNDAAYRQLARYLRKGGFTPDGKKWENLHATRHGMAGFGPQFANYVAYISTKPITERLIEPVSFPTTYSDIESFYGHIIMTVCSTLSTDKKPIYENRGIFRNPLSLIKGGHSHVSTQLHVFTAKIMHGMSMQYLTVRPLPTMKDILVKTIGSDKVKIGDEIPEPLRDFPALGFGMFDINMLIKLDDIATLYDVAPPKEKTHKSNKKKHKSKKKK